MTAENPERGCIRRLLNLPTDRILNSLVSRIHWANLPNDGDLALLASKLDAPRRETREETIREIGQRLLRGIPIEWKLTRLRCDVALAGAKLVNLGDRVYGVGGYSMGAASRGGRQQWLNPEEESLDASRMLHPKVERMGT